MTSSKNEHQSWTAAGSDAAATKTYNSIRTALAEVEQRRGVEVFLQGSYANATNIRSDSDVDIVVMTKLTFQGSVERLGAVSKAAYEALPAASFSGGDLRSEVHAALIGYYGSSRVISRNKCITVKAASGYVDADVVPCLQYRWYPSSTSDVGTDYVEGVALHPLNGGRIINFPKEHRKNGAEKNALCGDRYKRTVRQVKRLRNRAVDEGRISKGAAPGYLLECLVFNVPNNQFVFSDSDRLRDVLIWLKFADMSDFRSCDNIHTLFKTDPGDFDLDAAQVVIDALWEAF